MNKIYKDLSWILLFFLPTPLFAWHFMDLWRTPDQQGAQLLQEGKAREAAQVFKNKDWQGVASYRAQNYGEAYERFHGQKTSDGQYNAGNAAAFSGRYQEALDAYDKALALNPNNTDAKTNREIVKKLMEQKKQQNNSSNSKNSSASDKKNDKNAENKSDNKQSDKNQSEQQKQAQNNSSQNKDDKDQNAQNNQQKENNQDKNPQQNADNSPAKNNNNNQQQTQQGPGSGSKQDNQQPDAYGQRQAQDENQNQMLRRLSDDPGGLLRQKFLRDYFRRHGGSNAIEGDD